MQPVAKEYERSALHATLVLLQQHLGEPRPGRLLPLGGPDRDLDALIQVGTRTFAVEVKRDGTASSVTRASQRLLDARHRDPSRVPLVVVNSMTPAGRSACRKLHLSWLDLAGNAEITGEGLRIAVGDRRATRPRGRPPSVFTALRSRIIRHLLMFSRQAWTQRELSVRTGLSEADTSRVVRQLEQDQRVVRDARGAVRVVEAAALLDDWRDVYDFGRHVVLRGHVQTRSGEQLTRSVAAWLTERDIEHAATGLAGAWLWTQFAAFRVATFFLARPLIELEERKLGLHRDELGGNLWLVTPEDPAVFVGAEVRRSVRAVHPIQIYLDLKAQPERADEAAERLRSEHLKWN